MSFDNLPDEIILQIFSLFSLKQLRTKLRLVNNRWRRLADDDSHYRKLILKSNVSTQMATHLLKKYGKNVKTLQLLERTDVNNLAPYMKECINLESLTLTLCHENGDYLTEALKYCQRLNAFAMQHCECVRNVSDLLDVIAEFPVSKINLRNVQPADDINFWRLRNIEDFRLKSVNFNFVSICRFCQSNKETLKTLKLIPSNKDFSVRYSILGEELRDIQFDLNEPPQKNIYWMTRSIGECSHLRSLCLGPLIARELNDEYIVPLCNLNSLTTLVLHQANFISDIGFENLFRQPMSENLTKISLYKCMWVTSNVLKTIAKSCKNLEKFVFEKCRHTQTNQDHEDILALVKCCSKVKKLHLFGMDICVAHVLHLLPEYLPRLQSLKYSNDSEPMNVPSFLPELEERMPDFNVSGLQWKFNLHVNCKRKSKRTKLSNITNEYVCALDLKTQASDVV